MSADNTENTDRISLRAQRWIALLFAMPIAWLAPHPCRAQTPDPLAGLDRTVAAAESALQEGELEIAESRYRSSLFDAWMLLGALKAGEGKLTDARDDFLRAAASAVDNRLALQSLGIVYLQLGSADEAVNTLRKMELTRGIDGNTRRLLARALVASGRPAEAVQELEEAHGAAPKDDELTFLLASGYLRLKKIEAAERLFAEVEKARPIPQTYVLIGRAYRDAGEYDRARRALRTALKLDPRARRAHYYLGTIAVMAEGVLNMEEALAEFRHELKLEPGDPLTNLRLGMALAELQRQAEALAPLEIAMRAPQPSADAFHYMGRCLVALDRPADAIAPLRRALELSSTATEDDLRLLSIHYLLGQALRSTGATEEATVHFAAAERTTAVRAEGARERLRRYMSDAADPQAGLPAPPLDAGPLAVVPPAQRAATEKRLTSTLARSYLNLGVIHAQAGRFDRAAELFAEAAAADSAFPQVQYSLGVALFNAHQYGKAAPALERALAADPGNAEVRRMLAVTSLNTGNYTRAVELLGRDPQREADPSLQYVYGVSLVRTDRGAEAEAIFSQLLARHGDRAELHVVIGQAHAQQGDFESAIASLKRALELKPDVADANAALGVIYLRQGRLDDAAKVLQAELTAHPADQSARHTLATVLDLQGHSDQAIGLLRQVLKARPEYADARYLLGKILLARGSTAEALDNLEAAVRLAPEDANIHYQLGQAYQKSGRPDLAEKAFATYRLLKDKRREPLP